MHLFSLATTVPVAIMKCSNRYWINMHFIVEENNFLATLANYFLSNFVNSLFIFKDGRSVRRFVVVGMEEGVVRGWEAGVVRGEGKGQGRGEGNGQGRGGEVVRGRSGQREEEWSGEKRREWSGEGRREWSGKEWLEERVMVRGGEK